MADDGVSPTPTLRTYQGFRRVFALAGILIVLIMAIWGAFQSRDEGLPLWQLYLMPPAILLASMGPYLFYLTDLRSLSGSLVVGMGMVATTVVMLYTAFTNDSTAAFFLLVLSPLANLALVGIALLIDFLRFGPSREEPKSQLPLDDARYRMDL